MKSLSKDMIEAKFDIIERNLKFLLEFKNAEDSAFLKSFRDVQATKYSLLEVTEACIDIANHIIAAKGYRRAERCREFNKFDAVLNSHIDQSHLIF